MGDAIIRKIIKGKHFALASNVEGLSLMSAILQEGWDQHGQQDERRFIICLVWNNLVKKY